MREGSDEIEQTIIPIILILLIILIIYQIMINLKKFLSNNIFPK